MSVLKMFASSVLCAAMVLSASVSALAADHSTEEILKEMKELSYEMGTKVEYDEEFSAESPYVAGKISEKDLNNGLNVINLARYIAGLDSVTLDDTYNNYAQHGAVLNLSNGKMEHNPEKPDDMAEDFFDLGYTGCSEGNLSTYNSNSTKIDNLSYRNLADSVIAWLSDSDSSNRSQVGHRRWVLSPKMAKTGFGMAYASPHLDGKWYTVSGYSSMYAFDQSQTKDIDTDYICWPARNMPYSLYETIYNQKEELEFSVSLGKALSGSGYDELDASKITVNVVNEATGETISIDKNYTSPNYFSVNNDGAGTNRCIIFSFGKCSKNDIYDITITGITKNGVESPINYTVSLFDDESIISDAKSQVLSDYQSTESTTMRVLASVHSIDLEEAGFVFSLKNENPTIDGENCKKINTDVVYTSIKANGNNVTAYDLSGTYIATAKIKNIPKSAYDTPIYVRSYAKEANGEYVYGTTKTFTVNN